jgi:hypothetical protein
MMLNVFYVLTGHLYVWFYKCVFIHFSHLRYCFYCWLIRMLYILFIWVSWQIWLINIFSHYLFTFLMVFFKAWKFLHFVKSNALIFILFACILVVAMTWVYDPVKTQVKIWLTLTMRVGENTEKYHCDEQSSPQVGPL